MVPKVMIILGSGSDIKIAEKAMNMLEKLEITYCLKIASAHRTHQLVREFVEEGTKAGVKVFIGIAGLAAHLPGSIAAYTHRPVIGVPVKVNLEGIDALYASVQMPYPVPVATVGIDRGDNAALLAGQILAISDEKIRENMLKVRKEYKEKVIKSDFDALNSIDGEFLNKEFLCMDNTEIKEESFEIDFKTNNEDSPDVAIISGSYSDMAVAKKVEILLERLRISYDLKIISPVRDAKKFEDYVHEMDGVKLFIGINGLSSQVTGGLVGLTNKPVIGVPCTNETSVDSLLSMVNMPPGVPVATVGLNNGRNAGILAAEILGIDNPYTEEILKEIKYKKSNL